MPGEHERKTTTIWWPHGRDISGCQVKDKCLGFVIRPHAECVEDLRAFYQSAILVVATTDKHRTKDPDLVVLGAWPAKAVPNTDGEYYQRMFPPMPLRDLYVNLLFARTRPGEFKHDLRVDIGAVCASEEKADG